jgi:hypothetical protein
MRTQIHMADDKRQKYGDEAPTWKHMVIAFLLVGLLIALSWIAWFKFGWFH